MVVNKKEAITAEAILPTHSDWLEKGRKQDAGHTTLPGCRTQMQDAASVRHNRLTPPSGDFLDVVFFDRQDRPHCQDTQERATGAQYGVEA